MGGMESTEDPFNRKINREFQPKSGPKNTLRFRGSRLAFHDLRLA